jgi:hypothetical protein
MLITWNACSHYLLSKKKKKIYISSFFLLCVREICLSPWTKEMILCAVFRVIKRKRYCLLSKRNKAEVVRCWASYALLFTRWSCEGDINVVRSSNLDRNTGLEVRGFFLVFIVAENVCLVIGMNFSYSTTFTVRNLIHGNSHGEVTEKESEQKIERKIWKRQSKRNNLKNLRRLFPVVFQILSWQQTYNPSNTTYIHCRYKQLHVAAN